MVDKIGFLSFLEPLLSTTEPVGSVWIGQESHREQVGTSCCDDPLSTETLRNVSNNAKQRQTLCTASSRADPPNTSLPAFRTTESPRSSPDGLRHPSTGL